MSNSGRSEPLPVLAGDLVDLGLSRGALRGHGWQRIYWGVHVVADVELDVKVRAQAGLLLHPVADAHLSHSTVAQLLGIPVPVDDEIHVTVHARRDRHYRAGLRPHFRAAPSDCAQFRGMPISAALQLFVELAATLPLVDTVVAGDHMVRHGFFTRDELVDYCARLRGKHVRKSRRAAALVRAEVDSPMETRLRLLLVFAGLPEPEVNFRIVGATGRLRRRLDLSYPRIRLIVEYDGRHHIERVGQWESDLDRREELDEGGWRIIVVTSAGIFHDPLRTIERVRRALVQRGVRVSPINEGWRAHFPVA
ncbi:DUF559 domain-containing protein [Nocardioides mangrovicus]|uniref:DUF559 domain-containing protein n=1 Tax=Nocardioides mangrovicus TaxID=2478913 RepID=A0A3L8NY31_9ACTN|nr:DUF559 domain-containing protein [Nocardioides mangrovicus]RLV47602.1 DUF559 domain-containing protein [Nocardioides mangrovicus]